MKKIKVLHLVPGLDAGGISMLLLNYYKLMDRNKISFDFAIFYDYIGMTGQEFKKMGSKIYFLPKKSKDLIGYLKKLFEIINSNDYDIVHVHQNYLSFFSLMIAKKCGVKIRIVHSHSSQTETGFLHKLYYYVGRFLNKIYATDLFSCGEKAALFLFGTKKDVFIVNNAIDVSSYEFNEGKREKKRKQMSFNDDYVICHVGRLSYVKNQRFLIDILERVLQNIPNAKLVFVGNGEMELELKEYVSQKQLDDSVIFLGIRDDVDQILQASDLFVLPSLSEGLPVSGVEAIASGIPCLFSDSVTKELLVRDGIEYISLNDVDGWINAIINYKDCKRYKNNNKFYDLFDIKRNAKLLEEKYISLVNKSIL